MMISDNRAPAKVNDIYAFENSTQKFIWYVRRVEKSSDINTEDVYYDVVTEDEVTGNHAYLHSYAYDSLMFNSKYITNKFIHEELIQNLLKDYPEYLI